MITATINLRDEPLEVAVAIPTGEPPVGYIRIGQSGSMIVSTDPDLLADLASAALEAATRLEAARDVHAAQRLGATA